MPLPINLQLQCLFNQSILLLLLLLLLQATYLSASKVNHIGESEARFRFRGSRFRDIHSQNVHGLDIDL